MSPEDPRSGGPAELLPVLPENRTVGRARYSRWRAATLSLVILLILVHMGHFIIAGWTYTVVDPAEMMYFLEIGVVNVGVVFSFLLIAATLLFGRFFCGWACHILAFEDGTSWLLKKVGITLRPFRSRLLWLAPFVALFYMYVWPQIERVRAGGAFPDLHSEWTTTDVWGANPGWTISILTLLTCSILIVYVLGSRGFCAYACPYGAALGLLQKLSPWTIRAVGECDNCGKCTESCPSDIAVHEEIKKHGEVIHRSCLRDLDCVDNCPQQVLSFKAGVPGLLKKSNRVVPEPGRYAYAWWEELLLAGAFIGSLYALHRLYPVRGIYNIRGLYDAIPFLMALGCSAIAAVIVVDLLRLLYRPALAFHTVSLKADGRVTRAGWIFGTIATLVLVFLVHSGFHQWHLRRGEQDFWRVWQSRGVVVAQTQGGAPEATTPEAVLARSFAHFQWCRRWGLIPLTRTEMRLGALSLLKNDLAGAEQYFAGAVASEPESPEARYYLASVQHALGQLDAAWASLDKALVFAPDYFDDNMAAGDAAFEGGTLAGAYDAYATAARIAPSLAAYHVRSGDPGGEERRLAIQGKHVAAEANLAFMLARRGEFDAAFERYEAALRVMPGSPELHYSYGVQLQAGRHVGKALEQFQLALTRRPDFAQAHYACGSILAGTGRLAEAVVHFERVLELEPDNADAHYQVAMTLRLQGDLEAAEAHMEKARRVQ